MNVNLFSSSFSQVSSVSESPKTWGWKLESGMLCGEDGTHANLPMAIMSFLCDTVDGKGGDDCWWLNHPS